MTEPVMQLLERETLLLTADTEALGANRILHPAAVTDRDQIGDISYRMPRLQVTYRSKTATMLRADGMHYQANLRLTRQQSVKGFVKLG